MSALIGQGARSAIRSDARMALASPLAPRLAPRLARGAVGVVDAPERMRVL